ncbi:MAG TPA: hypothetical protein VFH99_03045 [Candidatus Saccharimonadales bacterium]|nr:hypothetical protein [Candidatus Saccharimonadales bacterium]
MSNPEHTTNHDIDNYIHPPLNPGSDPAETAVRLEAKRAKIRQSMETFSQRQAASAARAQARKDKRDRELLAQREGKTYRRPKLTYKDNPTGYGWLIPKDGSTPPILVSHDAKTDGLFISRNGDDEKSQKSPVFELIYQGSWDIVNLLEMQVLPDTTEDQPPRHLAFFDKKGVFYDQARLKRLDEHLHNDGETFSVKHTAVFSLPHNGKEYDMPIAIDNIYCISLARPEDPGS